MPPRARPRSALKRSWTSASRIPRRSRSCSRDSGVDGRGRLPSKLSGRPDCPRLVMAPFAERLLEWFDQHGRHDLPWQHPRTPYRVWLSEIMLQQTQVRVVIPYFERFVVALPDLRALAQAPRDDVLALWSGLGYYARARNLHATAQRCLDLHDGELPRDLDALLALPGIGRST